MASPDRDEHTQYPTISAYRTVGKRSDVDTILRSHDYGTFSQSGAFLDELLTDTRMLGVNNTRNAGLLSAPLEFRPAWDAAKPRKLAELLGGKDGALGAYQRIVSNAAISDVMTSGRFLGLGVAQIKWERTAKSWMPRLVPWSTRWVRWDYQKRRFILQTAEGEVILPRPDEQPEGDGQWFVYCPYGVEYGWKRALIRCLAELYLMRQWNFRDWARANERHGLPILLAKFPITAKPEEKAQYFRSINNIGAEAAAALPQGADGQPSFDLGMLESMARTWDSFKLFKSEIDTEIAITLLGQNLTTEVQGGSFAAAAAHNLVRLDIAKFDAGIANDIHAQVLSHWARFNFGDAELAPRPEYMIDPPADEKSESDALLALGSALETLARVSPRVDIDTMLEEAGIPLLDPGDVEDLEAEESPTPPDGEVPPDDEAGEDDTADGGEDAEEKLSSVALRADGKPRARAAAGSKRAAKYEDKVVAKGKLRARQAMSRDLEDIVRTVQDSTSPDDLKKRLATQFQHYSAARLAKVVQKANVLSNLAGRHYAILDV